MQAARLQRAEHGHHLGHAEGGAREGEARGERAQRHAGHVLLRGGEVGDAAAAEEAEHRVADQLAPPVPKGRADVQVGV